MDSEDYDLSEQQFAASVEAGPQERRDAPRFLPESLVRRSNLQSGLSAERTTAEASVCAETETGVYVSENRDPVVEADALETPIDSSPANLEQQAEEPTPMWRQEVTARVHNYHSRRRRRPPRYPSLNLKFDSPVYARSESSELPKAFANCPQAAPSRTEPGTMQLASMARTLPAETRPLPLDSTNVIEFPRSLAPPAPAPDELAEPILDKPRILEAPEALPQELPLGGIVLEAPEEPVTSALEVPLQVAPLAARIMAAILDGVLVLIAVVVFLLAGNKVSPVALPPRSLLLLTAILTGVLWSIFQYMFLVYTGTSPGLELAQLRLSRLDGSFPPRDERRWRALAMALSALPVGMGFLWCLLDEDTLCWHDRITRTYLSATGTSVVPAKILGMMKRIEHFLRSRVEGATQGSHE